MTNNKSDGQQEKFEPQTDSELSKFFEFLQEPDLQEIAEKEQKNIFVSFGRKTEIIDTNELQKEMLQKFEEKEISMTGSINYAVADTSEYSFTLARIFSEVFIDKIREISPLTEYTGWETADGVDEQTRDYVVDLLTAHLIDKFYDAAIPILAKLFCELLASASPVCVKSRAFAADDPGGATNDVSCRSSDYGVPDYDPLDYNPGGAK